jgi:NADH-quinone oxidoreductase subunit M
MMDLSFPWIQTCLGVLLFGGLWVSRVRNADAARRWAMLFSGLALFLTCGMYADFRRLDFQSAPVWKAHDCWDLFADAFGPGIIAIDDFSAPLLPLTAMLFLLTTVATLRTKIRRFSFAITLISEAIVLATLSCREPWGIILLMAAATAPPYLEMKAREKSTRVFALHMGLFIVLLALGWAVVDFEGRDELHSAWALVPLLVALFIRCGTVPVHCWMTDLFENATFGTALLFVTPLPGEYAAVRLLLPIAPTWVLHGIAALSITTAVYAAGMALVQKEARRFFCYVFLSHSALVLVGLETTPSKLGLTGALCVWLSVGLALSGFGLTMRALESRHGRLTLTSFRGIYEHTPALAICFLLTGLASVGFPGTFGFIGTEMLVDAAVGTFPYVGMAAVVAAALNGIAIVKAYFLLFTGARHASPVSLRIGKRERFAVLTLAALILCGGLFPQIVVNSRFHAAEHILNQRQNLHPEATDQDDLDPWGD